MDAGVSLLSPSLFLDAGVSRGVGVPLGTPRERSSSPLSQLLPPLCGRPSDDHFMQIMCIRKGKRLVARILPFLSPEQAADVLMATARNLPFLIKKDAQDEVTAPRGWEGSPCLAPAPTRPELALLSSTLCPGGAHSLGPRLCFVG